MPTNSRGCWAVPLTPASPTMPIANPAANPARPTAKPAPRWQIPLGKKRQAGLFQRHQSIRYHWQDRHSLVQRVLRWIIQGSSYENRDHQSVNCNDSSHDDGYDRLHYELWSQNTHSGDACSCFCGSISSSKRWKMHPERRKKKIERQKVTSKICFSSTQTYRLKQ